MPKTSTPFRFRFRFSICHSSFIFQLKIQFGYNEHSVITNKNAGPKWRFTTNIKPAITHTFGRSQAVRYNWVWLYLNTTSHYTLTLIEEFFAIFNFVENNGNRDPRKFSNARCAIKDFQYRNICDKCSICATFIQNSK